MSRPQCRDLDTQRDFLDPAMLHLRKGKADHALRLGTARVCSRFVPYPHVLWARVLRILHLDDVDDEGDVVSVWKTGVAG